MKLPTIFACLLAIGIRVSQALFLGPTYPAPVDLSSNSSLVHQAWRRLSSTIDGSLSISSNSSLSLEGARDIAFSLGVFSTQDLATASSLQYHFTPVEVANSTNGTRTINGDSIYRIASVSKLITAFAGKLELTEDEWDRPLAGILPELASVSGQNETEDEPIYTTEWHHITPRSLASQLSGVSTIGLPAADLLLAYGQALSQQYGFPVVDASALGPCWSTSRALNCTISESVKSIQGLPPNFSPFTTPVYSDEGFMLLGAVIATLRNRSMASIYQDAIFEPLGMASSYYTPPVGNPNAVHPPSTYVNFALDLPFTTPSGGLFSTINDLAKFGVGVLNSTLMSSEETRKWMKPTTHTASLTYSLGAGWEVIRYTHPTTGKVTDLYTKLGDSGSYGGELVLIPDYNAGFIMLNAGATANRSSLALAILDVVAQTLIPALEAQAAAEAASNIVGTYISTNADVNSTLTIMANETTGALLLSTWISNGTDMLAVPILFDDPTPQLLPVIRDQLNHPGEIAFRISRFPQLPAYDAPGAAALGATGPFSGFYYTNFDWLTVGQRTYGGVPIDFFVFEMDHAGYATTVRTAAARATLKRT